MPCHHCTRQTSERTERKKGCIACGREVCRECYIYQRRCCIKCYESVKVQMNISYLYRPTLPPFKYIGHGFLRLDSNGPNQHLSPTQEQL